MIRRVLTTLSKADRYDVLITLGMACAFGFAMLAWAAV